MKKILLSMALACAAVGVKSQSVTDTVSIGAGYANQVWYSLQNDNQGSAPKNNWDIAFDCGGMGSGVMINSATGTTLWKYPKSDTTGWSSIDTTGLSTWTAHYNSDTSWSMCAMGAYANFMNPYDLDWGVYNMITHFVTGDSIYIIKLSTGAYKKLWIVQLAGSTYSFRYADLGGSNLQNASVTKNSTKNFMYYSLQTNTTLDREPASADWDLVFTQYTAFIPIPYTVTGVLQNNNVHTAEVHHLANPQTYNNWASQSFYSAINTIGYDWKTYTGSYVVDDSLAYFIKPSSGDVWRVVFTGFGGSANGNYIFTKEKISSVGIKMQTGNVATVSLYPNPSNGGNVTLLYDFESNVSSSSVNIFDLSGRQVYNASLENNTGLHTHSINTNGLNAGAYIVYLNIDGQRIQQKLIIQ